jgi:hypothetical protein
MQSAFYSTRGALALSGSIDAIDLFPSPGRNRKPSIYYDAHKKKYLSFLPIKKMHISCCSYSFNSPLYKDEQSLKKLAPVHEGSCGSFHCVMSVSADPWLYRHQKCSSYEQYAIYFIKKLYFDQRFY